MTIEKSIFVKALGMLAIYKNSCGDDMWVGRTIDFTVALDEAFEGEELKIETSEELNKVKELITLDNLIDLAFKTAKDQPRTEKLRTYLIGLPRFNVDDLDNQDDFTYEYHGHIAMQLDRVLNDLNREDKCA